MLKDQLKHAAQYWKTDGPAWVARVAAEKAVEQFWFLFPPLTYRSLRMYLRLGYWPDIEHPRTFNEKVAHRQVFVQHPLASLVADKWRVREFVAERGLAHLLNEVYCATDNPEEIPFGDLPDRFVIKANHGSHWNIIVKDKSSLDHPAVIRQCRKWLRQKYGKAGRCLETHYDSIKPMVLVEKLLEDRESAYLRDYKFYCFHGRVHHIYIFSPAPGGRTLNVYDRDWNEQGYTYLARGTPAARPAALPAMLDAAERLSRDIDFCRVDMYLLDGEKLVFGEITMNPQGSLRRFRNKEMDLAYGELW